MTDGPFQATEAYNNTTAGIPDIGLGYTQANPTAAPPVRPYNENRYLDAPGVYNGQMCNPSNHYFECKHEVYCFCGRTMRRTDLQMDEGL